MAETNETAAKELVDHPSHYGGADAAHETIKCLAAWLTSEQFSGFLLGNAIKYLSRAGRKGTLFDCTVDLRKAIWYINKEVERLQATVCDRCHASLVVCDECGRKWCLNHQASPLVCPGCGVRPSK